MIYKLADKDILKVKGEFNFTGYCNGFNYAESDTALNAPWIKVDKYPQEYLDMKKAELEPLKAQKLQEILDAYEAASNDALDDMPLSERLTWSEQEKEALAYFALSQNEQKRADKQLEVTPLLYHLSKARGVELSTLATKVLEKATIYREKIAKIIGTRQKLVDLVENSSDANEISSVSFPIE